MRPALRRQVIALAVALGVLVVVAVVQLRGRDNAAPAAPRTAPSNQASTGRGTGAQVPVTDVKLGELKKGESPYPEPRRNPFEFRAREEEPGPRLNGRGGRGGRGAGTPQPAPPPVPAGPPPLPPIPFRFIGYYGLPGGGGLMGVFSDGQGHTVPAKEGDIIDGRYRVLRVGQDSADVAYVDGRGRQSLRLSGQ